MAAVALAREARATALVAVWIELVGVGALSRLRPQDFPEPTVWSGFGIDYGFVPLVLPVLGLLWLRRRR